MCKAVAVGLVGLEHYFQGKSKISFYKNKVVNRNARVIIEVVRLVILWYSR